MISRFVKYNKILVGLVGITAVAVIALAVLLVIEYIKMSDANKKVADMKNDIAKLLDARFNKVIAVPGNLTRLQEDKKFYVEQEAKIKDFFGTPYAKALDAMTKQLTKTVVSKDDDGNEVVTKVPYENSDDFANDFITFLQADKNEDNSIRLERFRSRDIEAWNKGLAAFIEEADKVSFETVDLSNAIEYFFMAIGLSRDTIGGSLNYSSEILEDYKNQLFKYVLGKNITLSEQAANFDLLSNANSVNDENVLSNATFSAEIISDLISRICSTKPKINSIDSFTLKEIVNWKDVNDGKINRYKLVISGTPNALREVIKNINTATVDNRVYVIRNAKIMIDPAKDEAAGILNITNVVKTTDTSKTAEELEVERLILANDARLPYNERMDYGNVEIGATKNFVAELEIDYYYFKKNVNK